MTTKIKKLKELIALAEQLIQLETEVENEREGQKAEGQKAEGEMEGGF